jgi:cytoskeleton protein RodZ
VNTSGGQESNNKAAQGACPVSGERETGASIDQDTGQLALPLSSGRHIMRAEELQHAGKTSPEVMPQPGEEINLTMPERVGPPSFGQRLRTAREAKGLSRAEVAQRLRLPLRLIGRIEDDDYTGMDEGVYLRGYLSSYSRMVDVPIVAAETVAAAHMRSAPLVATGKVSRSRYLFDRYSVSATYLILTALIVVPAVWLATHGGLEQNLARTTPLDSPTTIALPSTGQPDASDATGDAKQDSSADQPAPTADDTTTTVAAVELPRQEQMPVVASMTPFATPSASTPVVEIPARHAPTGAHSLTLKLSAASWVEIVGADGSKLEYGLLPAGAEKSYASDGPLSVRLGNADGTEVIVDGKPLDLAPFRRANVARLRVFGADGAGAPRAEF